MSDNIPRFYMKIIMHPWWNEGAGSDYLQQQKVPVAPFTNMV